MSALHPGSPARRGSYDGIISSPRSQQLKSLAQRRCSAPSLVFSKALSKPPWSSGRDSNGCRISVEQCPFVLGLSTENTELILHECVQLTQDTKTKERHLFLFSDMLIIAKLKSGTSFRLKHRVDLCELWAVTCGEQEEEEEGARELHINPRDSIILIWSSRVSIASFRSLALKELWLDTLLWQIKEIRGTEVTNVPSTRVLMKVLTSCHATKTLFSGNMEAFDCHSEGDFKKFHLLAAQYTEDGICQLIESNKKRRKVLSWPFPLRRSSTLTSESPDPLDAALKTTLFNQPLAIICDEDSLPKPIMDILTILFLKGPFVEGIFRKNANEKSRKELKEELNLGLAVDLDSKPVHLLAVVFKDFLRSIPHMLLSSDLHHEWMAALEKEDINNRIAEIKHVADMLPRPNLILLKYLMCVLHHISKQSAINKMDTSNLAICIGPNLLNPDQKSSQPLEAQKLLNDKVNALVEFFIENCVDIFGDDVSSLLCTPADDSLDHADGTELSSTQQNDSAYDSTDPEVEGLCSPPQNQQLQPQSIQCRCDHSGSGEQMDPQFGLSPACGRASETCIGKLDRRCSEPNLFLSQTCSEQGITRLKLTKSHDDVTAGKSGLNFEEENIINGHKDNSFPRCRYKNKKPLSLQVNTSLELEHSLSKTPSSCSLDSSCSNSSSSVFTSSPRVSPSSPKRRFFPRHESFSTKTCEEGNKMLPTNRPMKKHSMSFSILQHKKILTKTQSWEPDRRHAVSKRNSLKKDFENAAQRMCNIVKECSGKEQESPKPCQPRARLLSADEVFKLVDQRNPGKPPSYEEAIQRSLSAKLPSYRSLTVQTLRSTVLNQDSVVSHSLHDDNVKTSTHGLDASIAHVNPYLRNSDADEEINTQTSLDGRILGRRPRTMSEFQQQNKQEYFTRRYSQPLYDQIQYAKESYV